MKKAKLYKIDNRENKNNYEPNNILVFFVSLIVYSFALILTSYIFEGLYVENFLYAFVASMILNILNYLLKPLLMYLTLPITIISMGFLYPISNMIILYLCSIIMGSHFQTGNFISLFFASIFLSFIKIILDKSITYRVGGIK